jgi:hypothetical protein
MPPQALQNLLLFRPQLAAGQLAALLPAPTQRPKCNGDIGGLITTNGGRLIADRPPLHHRTILSQQT